MQYLLKKKSHTLSTSTSSVWTSLGKPGTSREFFKSWILLIAKVVRLCKISKLPDSNWLWYPRRNKRWSVPSCGEHWKWKLIKQRVEPPFWITNIQVEKHDKDNNWHCILFDRWGWCQPCNCEIYNRLRAVAFELLLWCIKKYTFFGNGNRSENQIHFWHQIALKMLIFFFYFYFFFFLRNNKKSFFFCFCFCFLHF